MEEEQHHGLSEADHLAAGREEEQQCANDMKMLPKFSIKHHLKSRECMVHFLREGRGADFRLAVITRNKVISSSKIHQLPGETSHTQASFFFFMLRSHFWNKDQL